MQYSYVPEWSHRNPGVEGRTLARRDVLAQVPNCPPLSVGDSTSRRGPGPTTNWLIPGRLLCGAMPEPVEGDHRDLSAVTHFVDLTEMDAPLHFRQQAEARATAAGTPAPSFTRHTIEEFTQGTADSVLAAVSSLMEALQDPTAVVYLHCRAGHGRTGMVAAIFIGVVYPTLEIDEVMQYIQRAHDDREDSWGNWESPETVVQCDCARSMIATLREQASGSADSAAPDAAVQRICGLCDPALRFVALEHAATEVAAAQPEPHPEELGYARDTTTVASAQPGATTTEHEASKPTASSADLSSISISI